MKIGPLSGEPFYRMHTPRWAVMPTSGAGAAKHGGRFNRPGVPALYVSDEPQTAIAEYKQDLTLMPPGRGRPIGAMDALVASTAQVHGLTLVTRNAKDFEGAVESVLNPWT